MAKAYHGIREVWVNSNGKFDMRTAAFVLAISKVGSDYKSMGIWP
jgi:glutamate dehydrogenase (NAD(P)+)